MHAGYSSQAVSQITSQWRDESVAGRYRTGVSLHSDTSYSEESLQFVHKFVAMLPFTGRVLRRYEREYERIHGLKLDFVRAFWRPPLLPKMAYDLEAGQIRTLGLEPLVSITDHDTIEAPRLLRTVPSARQPDLQIWTATSCVLSVLALLTTMTSTRSSRPAVCWRMDSMQGPR